MNIGKLIRKIKVRYWLIVFFALLALGGGVFYVFKYFRFGADTLGEVLTNQATISYLDQNQKKVSFYATSSTQKVSIPPLAVDPALNKRRANGQLIINDFKDNNIGELTVSFDNTNRSVIDWTDIESIDPSQKYNLILKLPGYLGKHLNSNNLNSAVIIKANQIWSGNANGDNIIDLGDFSVLMKDWGKSNVNADFNGDNTIDIKDFSVLMANWGKTE